MAKNEMTPQQAALTLRMVDGILVTSNMTKNLSPEVKSVYGQIHEAVELACAALVLMGDTSIEIDGGGKND